MKANIFVGTKMMKIAIIEHSNIHGEVYPTFVKYLIELGHTVHLYTTFYNLHQNSFARYDFLDNQCMVNHLDEKEFCQDHQFHRTLSLYDRVVLMTPFSYSPLLTLDYLNNKLYGIVHTTDEPWVQNLLNNNRAFVLRPGVKHNGDEIPFVVPSFFFGLETKIDKNTKTQLISVGGDWHEGTSNFTLLFHTIAQLAGNFSVNFIGVAEHKIKPFITPIIENHINYLGISVPADELFARIARSDFILWNKDNTISLYDKYLKHGTTGSFGLTLGFRKPPIVFEEIALEYGLDDSTAIMYTHNLSDAMDRAIRMSSEEYARMVQRLNRFREKLKQRSLLHLMRMIND